MEEKKKIKLQDYRSNYTKESFWDKIQTYASSAGLKVVVKALELFYSLDNLSAREKAIVYGTLGYLIFPLDVVPDLMPVVGYSDDLAALVVAYNTIKSHITPESISQAKKKAKELFPNVSDQELADAV